MFDLLDVKVSADKVAIFGQCLCMLIIISSLLIPIYI